MTDRFELPEAADLDSKDLDPGLRIALWAIQCEEWQSVMSINVTTYDGGDPGNWRGAHLLGTYGPGVRGESVRRALEANAETILREPEAWECGTEEPLSRAFEFHGDDCSRAAELLDAVATRLRTQRELTGRGQSDVAVEAGISPSTLSRIESGDRRPTLEQLIAIAWALGVQPAPLLNPVTRRGRQ